MSKLVEYLNALDSDAELKAAHDADPEGTMADYGLTDEEIAAVMSGDDSTITKASGVEVDSASSIQAIHIDDSSADS